MQMSELAVLQELVKRRFQLGGNLGEHLD
jgi:hypothetical protein